MRLPEPAQLRTESAKRLFAHDVAEYHCSNARDFYSQMQRARLHTVLMCAQPDLKNRTVLDLGCGQGNTGLLLAEAGLKVFAVDLYPEFLEYAGLKYERGTFARVTANAENLPFDLGYFDLVIWGEMIEHVAFPEKILVEIRRVLKPQGALVISTPNGSRLHTKLPTFAEAGDRSRFVSQQFKPDADGHLFLYTRRELDGLLARAGMQLVKHHYYATPWISGRLAFRHWMRWMPVSLRNLLDRCTLALPALAERLAEGQVLIARRT